MKIRKERVEMKEGRIGKDTLRASSLGKKAKDSLKTG